MAFNYFETLTLCSIDQRTMKLLKLKPSFMNRTKCKNVCVCVCVCVCARVHVFVWFNAPEDSAILVKSKLTSLTLIRNKETKVYNIIVHNCMFLSVFPDICKRVKCPVKMSFFTSWTDCSRYHACVWREIVGELSCHHGHHFSEQNYMCQKPEVADCPIGMHMKALGITLKIRAVVHSWNEHIILE